jgi:hypothetical protein
MTKSGKLKTIKNNKKSDSTIRFKLLKNGKEFLCCDFEGRCTNKAYAEVYSFMMKNQDKKGWNYLCRKHYLAEQKRLNGKLPSCLQVEC